MMISLYGKKYARNEKEFVGTLFARGETANGFYKVTNKGIYLLDMKGDERVFVRRDGLGPVTTFRHDGKRRYMYSASTLDGLWLCIPDSYIARCEGAKALADSIYL